MARAGGTEWEVTAVAPSFFHGDLRGINLEGMAGEPCRLEAVPVYITNRIHFMMYGRRLRQLLQSSWDLVHCWEEPYIFAGAQAAWWTKPQTPFVFWTAQNIAKRYPPPFSWLERFCLERCAGWLACGQTVVDALLPRAYDRKPYRIQPLGVDLDRFRPDLEAGAEIHRQLNWQVSGPPVVGYLGRFVAEKGLPILLSALERTKTYWRALFVGGGPLEKQLRHWAVRYPNRVRVVTGIHHEQVPAFLNAMDILCAPSQTLPRWREQLGRMVIEAFSCGVPVIASDSGEIPHVVQDAGVIVSEKDVNGWSHALSELLETPTGRRELSVRGIARAQDTYAWPIIARGHLDFFAELLDGRAGLRKNASETALRSAIPA
jgi:glycosyltransferase involved in cell wall biosynthesis